MSIYDKKRFLVYGCLCICVCLELKSGGVLDMTSEMEKKRQDHINELITTEDNYMKDLMIVLDVSKIR